MSTVRIPLVTNGVAGSASPDPSGGGRRHIVIDPVTRIEGHLRLEVEIDNGRVVDARSTGTMFRGLEIILQNRDPRDAWLFAQRICGVCTTVHALASVRAVENALGIQVPDNARLLRNLIEGAQFIQDHVIHFYHLHSPDWVDVVSALSADPQATARLAQQTSDWPDSGVAHFRSVRDRLQAFVASGQLGLFANAYWGHAGYRLSSEANLLLMSHYLQALDWQRDFIRMHALLGGKSPHPQTYLVGGMAMPVGANGTSGINPNRLQELRQLAERAYDFVAKVYLPDMALLASQYQDWFLLGRGYGNMLSYGDFPQANGTPWMPAGVVTGAQRLPWPVSNLDHRQISEHVAHSWYDGNTAHPYQGQTLPSYTGPQPPYDTITTDKYSWLKAPRYGDQPMEVGPLARVVVAIGRGHLETQLETTRLMSQIGVPAEALLSAMGRMAARAIETSTIAQRMMHWINALEDNIAAGDLRIHDNALWEPASWPSSCEGWGSTEAPRGGLGHWIRIENGTIAHYQAVVPTTWNGSPRDALGQRGVWEEALIGIPVLDPEQPLELLRLVHSFDPCMACAVHLVDAKRRPLGQANLGTF